NCPMPAPQPRALLLKCFSPNSHSAECHGQHVFVAALCHCEQLQKTLPACDYRHILAPIAERSSGAGRAQRADRQPGLGNKMSSRAEVATESWFEECVATLGEVHDENV